MFPKYRHLQSVTKRLPADDHEFGGHALHPSLKAGFHWFAPQVVIPVTSAGHEYKSPEVHHFASKPSRFVSTKDVFM
jgi:hypothetical protein